MPRHLMKQGWIAHGFDVLRSQLHVGLKADRMVKTFGVSRGSSYWHFEDVQTFRAELVVAWRAQINPAARADFTRILTSPVEV